jgi:hypothetical protein
MALKVCTVFGFRSVRFARYSALELSARDANLCYRSIMKVAKAAKIPVTGGSDRFVYDRA